MRKIFWGVLGGLFLFGLLLVLLLSWLLPRYLKPERIRAQILPRMEKTLQRKVELARVEVGLFKGIYLQDLAIKEPDGQKDFLRVEKLRVRLALWPLLRKKLVFTKAEITGLSLHLIRKKDGSFNWETLGPFQRETGDSQPQASRSSSGKPVFALVIPQFEIRNARLVFEDRTKVWPSLTIPFEMHARLTPEEAFWELPFVLQGEDFRLQARITELYTSPALTLKITGGLLDVTPFLPSDTQAKEAPSLKAQKGSGKVSSKKEVGWPFARVEAEIRLRGVRYRKLVLEEPWLQALFKEGRLTSEFRGKIAQGEVRDHIEAEFKKGSLFWKVKEIGENVEIASILEGLYPELPGRIKGRLRYEALFEGQGLEKEKILKTLKGEGSFEIQPLELYEIPATQALAGLLRLEELRTMVFSQARGRFWWRGEKVKVQADFTGEALSAHLSSGIFTLDGNLDLPVDLTFGAKLSKKLTDRFSFVRHLRNEKGEVVLTVHLRGPYRRPRVILRSQRVEKQIRKKVEETLRGILGR